MSADAITVENLAKSYRIERRKEAARETLLGQLFSRALARARGSSRSGAASDKTEHWALRDATFSVPSGQAVGIIGHNGAGKSTLLKILSRITHPTAGLARVQGRMASLLEVGTGFHPDLSGRDNVYMNAAILGMKRQQIRSRLDAIVDFSGVEDYIDTPIKFYSSGMKVRLAFAVAAHLEPNILVIDEVLAVGDAAFQQKCLGSIERTGRSGRTVLFVSHHLATVSRLCSRVLVLNEGRIVFDGRTLDGIRHYNEQLIGERMHRTWQAEAAPGDRIMRLLEVGLLSDERPAVGPLDIRKTIAIRMVYAVLEDGRKISPSVQLFDGSGDRIFTSLDLDPAWHNAARPAGLYESIVRIPSNFLNEGSFIAGIMLATLDPQTQHCWLPDAVRFTVADTLGPGTARGAYPGEMLGMIRPILQWHTERRG